MEEHLSKVFYIIVFCLVTFPAFGLEKCNFELVPEFFKIAVNFYTEDEKLEQKGYFEDITLKGGLFGNSIRDIVKNMEVFIPFNKLNTYNTTRDRIIYNHLVSLDTKKKGNFHIKVLDLGKKRVKLRVKIGTLSKDLTFKYDSRDVSMQSIGYIDLADFKMVSVKKQLEEKYNQKIWNDIFIDIRAKFNKNCKEEL